MYDFEEIRKEDPEIAEAIQAEMARQNSHIELIASENCGRVSGKTLLWRMPVCRCGRESGD